MLSATTFTYDGVHSGRFGLLIASFSDDNIQNTPILTPTINTIKTHRRKQLSFAGLEYDNMPPLTFSIIGEQNIPHLVRRDILKWLVGRSGFRKLQIHQPEYNNYIYNCIFTEAEAIYINGGCKGFTVTATFDSPYCYGRPTIKTFMGDGTEYKTFKVVNNSDTPDGYVYPKLTIKPTATFEDNGVDKWVSIKNKSDKGNPQRALEIKGSLDLIIGNEVLYIDSNLMTIAKGLPTESATTPLGNIMGRFNKNWLRAVAGLNEYEIKINGSVTIEIPNYVLIGF